MAKYTFNYLLICLVISEFLVVDIFGQFEAASLSGDNSNNQNAITKELQVNYELRQPHHIVKRKSKMGRGFGFGKKTKSKGNQQQGNRDPYPKQPAYNPNYNPGAAPGAPPAYPKQPGYNPSYPGAAPGAPPAYPGMSGNRNPSYPGAPPAYPGAGGAHHNMPGYPPSYGQPNYGYGGGYNQGGFGGKGYNKGGGGLGRTLGAAGFGAVAGTALGAYGGYKLGQMVGSLGRNGHYGYYDDYGKHIRCDPPREIKVDPETNITYIPLSQDYDKRCSYYDRRPPAYWGGYTNGAGNSMISSHPINQLISSIVSLTILDNLHLVWENVFVMSFAAVLLFH